MQKFKRILCLALCLVVGLSATASLANNDDLSEIEILGSIGLARSLENSCIAVWVPIAKKSALSGIKWYNNDGSIAFPKVLVQSGQSEYPVSLTDAITVARDVYGESGEWSELVFSNPVAPSGTGLYVILQVPADVAAMSEGASGGPALGYTSAVSGYPGWMSADGEDWVGVHPDYGLAVRPILVTRTEGMVTKSAKQPDGPPAEPVPEEVVFEVTAMKPAAPNPFNPQTTLSFTLREAGLVELAVYNLRGALVKQLVSQSMTAGSHDVIWDGKDRNGSATASGVYFARFIAGKVTMTQRLVLIQ